MRRIAVISAAVLVPVVVALLVLVNVLGGRSGEHGDEAHHHADDAGPAEIEGTDPSGRADLPVLPVEMPPVTPEADAACPALMQALPLELAGEPSRRVRSDSPYAYAWGEPPVVLRCGVERPAGYLADAATIQINDVQWFVDTADPDVTVWTAIDRAAYIEVQVPASTDSASVTELTRHVSGTVAYREPTPGQ